MSPFWFDLLASIHQSPSRLSYLFWINSFRNMDRPNRPTRDDSTFAIPIFFVSHRRPIGYDFDRDRDLHLPSGTMDWHITSRNFLEQSHLKTEFVSKTPEFENLRLGEMDLRPLFLSVRRVMQEGSQNEFNREYSSRPIRSGPTAARRAVPEQSAFPSFQESWYRSRKRISHAFRCRTFVLRKADRSNVLSNGARSDELGWPSFSWVRLPIRFWCWS